MVFPASSHNGFFFFNAMDSYKDIRSLDNTVRKTFLTILANLFPCLKPFQGFPVTSESNQTSDLAAKAFPVWPHRPVTHLPLASAHSLDSAHIELFLLLHQVNSSSFRGLLQRTLRPLKSSTTTPGSHFPSSGPLTCPSMTTFAYLDVSSTHG